jgi:hypothetical protein
MFSVGDKVVFHQERTNEGGEPVKVSFSGTITEERENPDGSLEYLVEYEVRPSRKGIYRTWWPAGCLESAADA